MTIRPKRTRLSMLLGLAVLLSPALLPAQLVATGVINGTLVHRSGMALVFNTAANGVGLGGADTASAILGFGTISAYGPLSPNVTRSNVNGSNYTVSTPFAIQVIEGGLSNTSYKLTANLAAAAPAGLTYMIDSVTLTTTSQTIQASASFNTDIVHTLGLVVSTAAPGAGGPAVGTQLSATVNFTATAN
ncbi:MAG: hypothetical protein ABSD88_02665 [Candidatus Korobacteraceae bacterium]